MTATMTQSLLTALLQLTNIDWGQQLRPSLTKQQRAFNGIAITTNSGRRRLISDSRILFYDSKLPEISDKYAFLALSC